MDTQFPYALDPSANKQSQILCVSCTVYVLALACVALRLVSRRISNAGYQVDDFLIILSLVINTGLFIDAIGLLHNGLGEHLRSVAQYSTFMKWYVSGDIMYTTTLAFTKYSILYFYWRIFGHVNQIRGPICVLFGLVTAWLIEVVLVSLFECNPVAYSWDLTIKGGHCVDLFKFFLATLVINFITDIMILALPMPLIWRLQKAVTQRILISGIFLLGSFVCMISIIRLTILLTTDFSSIDEPWNGADFTMWCNVEANIAIVSGCLPSLRPVLRAIGSQIFTLYQKYQFWSRFGYNSSVPSAKRYSNSSRQKESGVQEDILPMHTLQAHAREPVYQDGGPTEADDESSLESQAREQTA